MLLRHSENSLEQNPTPFHGKISEEFKNRRNVTQHNKGCK
jgi:hypothetical protein